MSINFSIYFSFANHQIPNYSGQWGLFEDAGMEFQPSGFYCSLSREGIIEAPGEPVVDNFSNFDRLAPEKKASLLQQWEHREGGGVTLGFVQSEGAVIGVLRLLTSDVDKLSQLFSGGKYELPQFLILSMSTLRATRLLAASDMSLTDDDAISTLLRPDFNVCADFSDLIGFGATRPNNAGKSCPSNFTDFSTENTILYFRYPFA